MQAVALVFEHVGSAHASTADGDNDSRDEAQEEGLQKKGSAVLAQQGAANAALKLLDDLCMMATGDSSELCSHAMRFKQLNINSKMRKVSGQDARQRQISCKQRPAIWSQTHDFDRIWSCLIKNLDQRDDWSLPKGNQFPSGIVQHI